MKILQLFNRYQAKGGEEKSAGRIFDHLSLRHEVEQLWWDSADWTGTSGPSRFGQMCRLFYNWDSARELRSRIRSFRPDTLLCHNLYPVGSPAVYKVALDTGIPVIQFIHNFRPFSVGGGAWAGGQVMAEGLRGRFIPEVCAGAWQGSILKSALFGLMLKRLHLSGWLRAVSCWVAISDFMRKKFVEAGVDSEQIVVLRHSWDMISRDAIPRDEGYYLFLSRLVPEKGVQTLLRAWELLEGKGAAPRLIIGGTGPLTAEVQAWADRLPSVEYRGYVEGEEKRVLIDGCRAMLAPSQWWEPLGLVVYEAYDAAKPILAAASGGLSETVKHGQTGFLHAPGDMAELAKVVTQIEKLGAAQREQMGQRGRLWLTEQASPQKWNHRFDSEVLPQLAMSVRSATGTDKLTRRG